MATKNITVPDIGGATDVVVIEVLVKPGDKIKVDSSLITVESDKATMEIPSTDEGVVKEVKVKVGSKVSQGTPVVVVETAGEEDKIPPNPPFSKGGKADAAFSKGQAESVLTEKTINQISPSENTTPSSPPLEKGHPSFPPLEKGGQGGFNDPDTHAGPAVRRIAREFGINLTQITGTGPKNRILKEDITAFVKSRLSQPSAGGGAGLPSQPNVDFAKFGATETQSLSRLKKLSGKNLHRNWLLVPHVTQFGEADITELEAFRQSKKALLEKQGVKLTPLVFIMKAVVAALKAFPQFNASLDASGENLILKKYFHIGVAVDTPDGLVVPVIRDVDKKRMSELAKELSTLSEKARNKQLTPNEMQGGCFSISSLGGIGGTAFTPIVNVPEVAILGVSKSSYKPVYENDKFVPRLMLPLSLSYDHRVIDGADGARFIVYLTELLSDIRLLLM